MPGENTREALQRWGIDDVEALLAAGVVVQYDASRAVEEDK
jgi:hypothetical protein